MNESIVEFAREKIIHGLRQLPERNIDMFKLMYGRNNGKRSAEDAKDMTIESVVSEIPESKLSWALTQVENTIKKRASE